MGLDAAARLATNGLPINEGVYVVDSAFEQFGAVLSDYGVTMEYVDFQITRSMGGAFRCSTQPLQRNA